MCTRNNLPVLDSVFRLSKCCPCFAFFFVNNPLMEAAASLVMQRTLNARGGAVVEQEQNLALS